MLGEVSKQKARMEGRREGAVPASLAIGRIRPSCLHVQVPKMVPMYACYAARVRRPCLPPALPPQPQQPSFGLSVLLRAKVQCCTAALPTA